MELRIKRVRINRSSPVIFFLDPCRYNASLENGSWFVFSGSISNAQLVKFFKKSVDGTYAVGLSLFSRCHRGFRIRGPQAQTCTASGNWEQTRHKENEDYYLTPNHPVVCLLGNTNSIQVGNG